MDKKKQYAIENVEEFTCGIVEFVNKKDPGFETHTLTPWGTEEYLASIHKNLHEVTQTREQKKARQRRMLADKMNVHEGHEQYCRIKKLANHLMHQSHEESQIAVQLFHNRREKHLFCETKIFTEMQCEKLRMQEFQDSMDTEKAMCRLHELSRRDKQQQEEALYVKYQDEQVHICCQKHYSMCFHIVLQITDFAAKIGEYFELMQRQLPEELLREWKYLFFHDQPLDDPFLEDKGDRKKERQALLDAQDFQEYQTMSGAWKFENEEPNSNLCPHDRVLGHIRYCIFDMASLKNMSSRPQLPPFSLKACFIGNLFSGKTLCLQKLHKEHGLIALQPESLLSKAMISSKATCDDQLEFSLANREHQEYTSVIHGSEVHNLLKIGKSVPDEYLIDLLWHTIQNTVPENGWILDGFPTTINQAILLDKVLTGTDAKENPSQSTRSALVACPSAISDVTSPAAGLDIAIFFDASYPTVFQRASLFQESNEESSPENEVVVVCDFLQSRIVGFQENWRTMEKLFQEHLKILHAVDANVDEETLYTDVKEILFEVKHNEDITEEDFTGSSMSTECCKDLRVMSNENCEDVFQQQPWTEIEFHSYVQKLFEEEQLPYFISCWQEMENGYIESSNLTFLKMRQERDSIISYYGSTRRSFKHFLTRLSNRNECFLSWKIFYNSFTDKLLEDEMTKVELHQKVDELKEKLSVICDNRNAESQQEIHLLMNSGYLEEFMKNTVYHFISLMQAEVNKHTGIIHFVKEYYQATEETIGLATLSQVMQDSSPEDGITKWIPQEIQNFQLMEQESNFALEQEKRNKDIQSKQDNCQDSAIQIILHYWKKAKTAVCDALQKELEMKEVEDKRILDLVKGQQKTTGEKRPKKKPAKSGENLEVSSGPKILASLNSETFTKEKPNKLLKSSRWKEYILCLEQEELATLQYLELIKQKSLNMITNHVSLKNDLNNALDDLRCEQFSAELQSIHILSDVMHQAVECGIKIPTELFSHQREFFFNGDVKLFQEIVPLNIPSPLKTDHPSNFTLQNLITVHQHFVETSPSGFISKKAFVEIFHNILEQYERNHVLPECWKNVNIGKIEILCTTIFGGTEFINWRKFLVAVAEMFPTPSLLQLMESLANFNSIDEHNVGCVTQEQFEKIQCWFEGIHQGKINPEMGDNINNIKKTLFHIFMERKEDVPVLYYIDFLLYFAVSVDSFQGFYRALSLTIGQPLLNEENTLNDEIIQSLEIPVEKLTKVFCHGGIGLDNNQLFLCNMGSAPRYPSEIAACIYKELGSCDSEPFQNISLERPFLQDFISHNCSFKLLDWRSLLQKNSEDKEC